MICGGVGLRRHSLAEIDPEARQKSSEAYVALKTRLLVDSGAFGALCTLAAAALGGQETGGIFGAGVLTGLAYLVLLQVCAIASVRLFAERGTPTRSGAWHTDTEWSDVSAEWSVAHQRGVERGANAEWSVTPRTLTRRLGRPTAAPGAHSLASRGVGTPKERGRCAWSPLLLLIALAVSPEWSPLLLSSPSPPTRSLVTRPNPRRPPRHAVRRRAAAVLFLAPLPRNKQRPKQRQADSFDVPSEQQTPQQKQARAAARRVAWSTVARRGRRLRSWCRRPGPLLTDRRALSHLLAHRRGCASCCRSHCSPCSRCGAA